jgi:hypothetical protein
MSEERKKQMLENLRKGRETAKRNRELKKQGKSTPAPKPKKKPMEIRSVNENITKELNTDTSNVSILNSIESLKKELAEMRKMPKSDFQKEEIEELKKEIAELKQAKKELKKMDTIKEEIKPPASNPIPVPQPQVYSTYSGSVWNQFK